MSKPKTPRETRYAELRKILWEEFKASKGYQQIAGMSEFDQERMMAAAKEGIDDEAWVKSARVWNPRSPSSPNSGIDGQWAHLQDQQTRDLGKSHRVTLDNSVIKSKADMNLPRPRPGETIGNRRLTDTLEFIDSKSFKVTRLAPRTSTGRPIQKSEPTHDERLHEVVAREKRDSRTTVFKNQIAPPRFDRDFVPPVGEAVELVRVVELAQAIRSKCGSSRVADTTIHDLTIEAGAPVRIQESDRDEQEDWLLLWADIMSVTVKRYYKKAEAVREVRIESKRKANQELSDKAADMTANQLALKIRDFLRKQADAGIHTNYSPRELIALAVSQEGA